MTTEKTLIKTNIDPNNPDTTIAVGDFVRSHDFPDRIEYPDPKRGDAYVEGHVTKIEAHPVGGYQCYFINISKRVWSSEIDHVSHDEVVMVPVNGTPTSRGRTTFAVEKIVANIKVEMPVDQWCQIIDTLNKSDAADFEDFQTIVDDLRDQVLRGHIEQE